MREDGTATASLTSLLMRKRRDLEPFGLESGGERAFSVPTRTSRLTKEWPNEPRKKNAPWRSRRAALSCR